MKNSSSFNFTIKIFSHFNKGMDIKQEILNTIIKNNRRNKRWSDENEVDKEKAIEQYITSRIMEISDDEKLRIRIENYNEREGSLIICFKLIIDILIAYGALRDVVDYIKTDLEYLLETDALHVHAQVFEIPDIEEIQRNRNMEEGIRRVRERRSTIIKSLWYACYILPILLAYIYGYALIKGDNERNNQKIEITVIGAKSLFDKSANNKPDSIILNINQKALR